MTQKKSPAKPRKAPAVPARMRAKKPRLKPKPAKTESRDAIQRKLADQDEADCRNALQAIESALKRYGCELDAQVTITAAGVERSVKVVKQGGTP